MLQLLYSESISGKNVMSSDKYQTSFHIGVFQYSSYGLLQEEFENSKRTIRIRKSKDRQIIVC
jgi:hypothetical protein